MMNYLLPDSIPWKTVYIPICSWPKKKENIDVSYQMLAFVWSFWRDQVYKDEAETEGQKLQCWINKSQSPSYWYVGIQTGLENMFLLKNKVAVMPIKGWKKS